MRCNIPMSTWLIAKCFNQRFRNRRHAQKKRKYRDIRTGHKVR